MRQRNCHPSSFVDVVQVYILHHEDHWSHSGPVVALATAPAARIRRHGPDYAGYGSFLPFPLADRRYTEIPEAAARIGYSGPKKE
jgi:hypothetical protein